MTEIDLDAIAKELFRRCKEEVRALLDDDPTDTCAAAHRGEIRAYGAALKLLLYGTPLYEKYCVNRWSMDTTRYYVKRVRDHQRPLYISQCKTARPRHVVCAVWSEDPLDAQFFLSQSEAGAASNQNRGTVHLAPPELVLIAMISKKIIE